MTGKVVFLAELDKMPMPYSQELLKEAEAYGLQVDIVDCGRTKEDVVQNCRDAEIAVLGIPPPSTDLLLSLPKLKFIQLSSAGFSYIDVNALGENGVRVANNPIAVRDAVAEHTIVLMLSVLGNVVESWLNMQHRRWDEGLHRPEFRQISGKIVGIVGMGAIGQEVAKRLRNWRTDIVYYDVRPLSPELEEELRARWVEFHELLRTSDIVTLHLALNESTYHMISADELSLMKPDAVLINTSLGGIVDDRALYEALKASQIGGAGLDVYEQEPVEPDNPLLDLDPAHVVLTPHTAGGSIETVVHLAKITVENVNRVLSKEEPHFLLRA
ncbi:MAG: 2-hydroxyacid dehydrogenase [Dehalococcoidia bacterium]